MARSSFKLAKLIAPVVHVPPPEQTTFPVTSVPPEGLAKV